MRSDGQNGQSANHGRRYISLQVQETKIIFDNLQIFHYLAIHLICEEAHPRRWTSNDSCAVGGLPKRSTITYIVK